MYLQQILYYMQTTNPKFKSLVIVPGLWQNVQQQVQVGSSPADPRRSEALPLPALQLHLLQERQPGHAHQEVAQEDAWGDKGTPNWRCQKYRNRNIKCIINMCRILRTCDIRGWWTMFQFKFHNNTMNCKYIVLNTYPFLTWRLHMYHCKDSRKIDIK